MLAAEANVRQIKKLLEVPHLGFKAIIIFVAFFILQFIPKVSEAENEFGITAGYNMSSWSDELKYTSLKSKGGITVGGYASIKLTKQSGIIFEALYSQKGSKSEETYYDENGDPNGVVKGITTFDYIEFPLLFEYDVQISQRTETFFLLGPVVSFEMKAEYKLEFPANPLSPGEISGDYNDTESLDIGILFGGGFKIKRGEWVLRLSAQYNYGLRGIFYGGQPKNRCLMFLVGVGQ